MVWKTGRVLSFLLFCLFSPSHSVATSVCGWMRICTWAAAAPATPSTTAAWQKPPTSESWSWRCGRLAEEVPRPGRVSSSLQSVSSLLVSFININHRGKRKRGRSFIQPHPHKRKSRTVDRRLLDLVRVIESCGCAGMKRAGPMWSCFAADSFLWLWQPGRVLQNRMELSC